MSLEADAGAKFDEELLMLKVGPGEIFDPMAKCGIRPLLWGVNKELNSAGQITLAIRRNALKKIILADFIKENEELKLFCKCYGAVQKY